MINLKIVDGDIVIESGNIAMCDSARNVAQKVKQRLQTMRNEHFIDVTRGFDWWRWFQPATSYEIKLQMLRACILGTDGVTKLLRCELEIDEANRSATVSFEATTDDGTISEDVTI